MPNTVRRGAAAMRPVSRDLAVPQPLDPIDHMLLDELQHNGRVTFAELARHVKLSKPSVMERIRKLESSGVIRGYKAVIDPLKLGLPVRAIVKVNVAGDRLSNFARIAHGIPEVVECHRVTGAESFIVHVIVRDMNHLETVIDAMMPYMSTNTSIVLNSPVQDAPVPLPFAPVRKTPRRTQ